MTDANLSTRLPQPRVMPCIVYIYLMIFLFVEQNDLQFASLSGRVTILSSTTASGSCGAVFLFRASSECRVPSACSSSNSTHKRCQGDHHCSCGFRQMWKMLKKPCWTSSRLWSATTNASIPLFEHFLQAGIAFYGTPLQLHEGSFPTSNSFVPKISAAEILTDTIETCFFIFIIQIWIKKKKSKGLSLCWVWTVLKEHETLQPQTPRVH